MIKGISERTGIPREIVKDVMEGFASYVKDEIVKNGEVYVPSYRLTLRLNACLKKAYKDAFNNFDDVE